MFRGFFGQEGKLEGWELDACGDCWVSDGCLVDLNDSPAAIDAYMYRCVLTIYLTGGTWREGKLIPEFQETLINWFCCY